MFYAIEQTRRINRFQDVKIPSARALYERYGASIGKGCYSTDMNEIGIPANMSSNVISNVSQAESLLQEGFAEYSQLSQKSDNSE